MTVSFLNSRYGNVLTHFDMDAIPRVNEIVVINNRVFKVKDISWNISETNTYVQILVDG